jgi:hypothetical protein
MSTFLTLICAQYQRQRRFTGSELTGQAGVFPLSAQKEKGLH